MDTKINIDPEFKALIPPLTDEERQELEASILAEGCRDPLIVWNGLLVDGHHRQEICDKHQLPYRTVERQFEDRTAVKIWIIQNQFGRRNLQTFQRAELALKLEPLIAAKAKANLQTPTGGKAGLTLSNSIESVNTQEELAKIAGVSRETIWRTRLIQREGSDDLKMALRQNKITLNKAFEQVHRTRHTQRRSASPPPRQGSPKRPWKLRAETQAVIAEDLKTKYPDYGTYVLERLTEPQRSDFLNRCKTAQDFGRPIRWPRPSEVFPGLNAGLDDRLIHEQHDQDIPLLEAMAKVAAKDQREFYERYLTNPAKAKLWATLPRWKRPLINKDHQAELIWAYFTIIRLELEYWAARSEGGLHAQGYSLCQKAGLLDSITDTRRLASVLAAYGSMLKQGEDLGNVTEPPWKNGR